MLTAREYLKRTNDNSRTCEMYNVIYEYLDGLTLDTKDPKAKRMLLKLHELGYGPYFDTDIAVDAVSHMKNVDGTTGRTGNMQRWKKKLRSATLIDRPTCTMPSICYTVTFLIFLVKTQISISR